MDPSNEFSLDALKNLEPLVNPVRQYRNRKQRQHHQRTKEEEQGGANKMSAGSDASANATASAGDTKLADVLSKITSVNKTADKVDRTKLIRTYNVKLRLKKPCLYKCFDCDVCFTNADFLELHEKTHSGGNGGGGAGGGGPDASGSGSGSASRNEIDLQQEQSFDESEMIVKQNAWFVGDFEESEFLLRDGGEEEDDGTIQLDCTVEEREDNFDITFDRTKCEKTYTVVKYKVKKDPVGKCEMCERLFYTAESLQLHRIEHERFLDFDAIEPQINIDSPSIEESTLVLDESFYQAETEDSDILDASDSPPGDAGRVEPAARLGLPRNGEWKAVPRRGSPPYRIPPREEVATIEAARRFQCDICARRFRFRPALNVHLRTHTNSRPFQCGECSRRFISRAKLFLHSYGHGRDRRAALRCDGCGETFRRPRQLLEHLQRGHDGEAVVGANDAV